jgi:glycosyltransferase involved in cell wall biosynthesis
LEVQACGRPVIAFGKGGALETVIDNKTGIFFEEQTPDSLADAILRFEE